MIPVSASVIWGELPSFWAKYNCCFEWRVYFVICTVFYILQVWRKAATTACVPCLSLHMHQMIFIPIIMGKGYQWTKQSVLSHCTSRTVYRDYQTVAPLSYSIASFPGLPHFFLPFAFTVIHGSGIPLLYSIVNTNRSQKQGGLGTRLVTLYPCFFICASLFSLSYSWTDTCPLTKNVLWLCKSKF